jgi:phosphoglycerate dehydrogenase-like enzyme
MHIVFHGESAAPFGVGFAEFLGGAAEVVTVSDDLASETERQSYAAADAIVSFRFSAALPRPQRLKLLHVPGAGYDAVDLGAVPASAVVCNCFGHGQAIAEYVMAALLTRLLPFARLDQHLRRGDWLRTQGQGSTTRDELADRTIGVLGFGSIGQAVAARAKAFEMNVHVANRSAVPTSAIVDRAFGLDRLAEFWPSADYFVVALPLTPETKGIVSAAALAAMRPTAVVVNVGRGPTVNEQALFDALQSQRIAGAVIDTWYRYPTKAAPDTLPSSLPFHELSNVIMTPHMSAWTRGTIRRRQRVIAENIERCRRGEPCLNVIRPAQA